MANKFYSKTKEINGVKYTAQFNGLSAALKAIDNSYVGDNSKNISIYKMASYIFDNVIVEPAGLTVDDFDSFEELNEVVRWGMEVMQGKFRDEDKKPATESSKK